MGNRRGPTPSFGSQELCAGAGPGSQAQGREGGTRRETAGVQNLCQTHPGATKCVMTCRDPDRCADIRKLDHGTDKPELLCQTVGMAWTPLRPPPLASWWHGDSRPPPPALSPQSRDRTPGMPGSSTDKARGESCLRPPLNSKSQPQGAQGPPTCRGPPTPRPAAPLPPRPPPLYVRACSPPFFSSPLESHPHPQTPTLYPP